MKYAQPEEYGKSSNMGNNRDPLFCAIHLLLLSVVLAGSDDEHQTTGSCQLCKDYCLKNILEKVKTYINMGTSGTNIRHFIDQLDLECGSNCDDDKSLHKGIWFTEISTKNARITFYPNNNPSVPLHWNTRINQEHQLSASPATCGTIDPRSTFHYTSTVQSDFCLRGNNCKPLNLMSCGYSGSYCENEIYSKLSVYRDLSEELGDDVILFTEFMGIRQRCENNMDIFTPSPTIQGIGMTKIQQKRNFWFQFFPAGNVNNENMRTFAMEGNDIDNLKLKCKPPVNPFESWNITHPAGNDQDTTTPCNDGENIGKAKLLNVIDGLFTSMSLRRTNFQSELMFSSGSFVRRSVISVDTSVNFAWKIQCETIPDTISSSSTSSYAPNEAQTTDDDKSKITRVHLAIAASLSFLAGVTLMLLLLLIMRYLGKIDICIGKKDGKRQVKWEVADNNICMQESEENMAHGGPVVNAVSRQKCDGQKIYSNLIKNNRDSDHVYETSQDTYEKLDTSASEKSDMHSDEHVYNAAQSTYQSLCDPGMLDNTHKGSEHVYTGIDVQQRARCAHKTENGTDVPNNTLCKPENLFENRASATSEHNYFTLQNDNFRLSGAVDESHAMVAQGTADPDTYFVLEKEREMEKMT